MKIPKIERLEKEIVGCRWRVSSEQGGDDICVTFIDAFRYWLWHCGLSPKIAFGWFRKKKKYE